MAPGLKMVVRKQATGNLLYRVKRVKRPKQHMQPETYPPLPKP